MKGKIAFVLMYTAIYAFFVYDGFCRFPKDKFFLGIYLIFYTFIYFFVVTSIIFYKNE